MRAKLIALGAVVAALGVGPVGSAVAAIPSNEADQWAGNSAAAGSSNTSSTVQGAAQSQSTSSSCKFGCGGAGQYQQLDQSAETGQYASSEADADQTAVNANVPVTISAGDVHAGDNSATQDAENSADADSSNRSTTDQWAGQSQESSADCFAGCGGSGQAQKLDQDASTHQFAESDADADQTAVNANVPVIISAGDVRGGDNSAVQDVSNRAKADSSNKSSTSQWAGQEQSSSSKCKFGCGGSGQFQYLGQSAETWQKAVSGANADQTAVNANVPVTISAGDVHAGDNSAVQYADNRADADSSNKSTTEQGAGQSQDSSSHCFAGCGESGQAQVLEQSAETWQGAFSWADAYQTVENTGSPVTVSKGKKGRKDRKDKKGKKDRKGGHYSKQ
jgi:hypothetical protein